MRTKVIQTRLAPAYPFLAITLFGFVLTRNKRLITPRVLNHELIHCSQQLEWFYIPFFVLYGIEWLWHFLRLHDRIKAYRAISFEREAYAHEHDMHYLDRRRPFANYLKMR